MEKEESQNNNIKKEDVEDNTNNHSKILKEELKEKKIEDVPEKSVEEKILELEDKLTRTFAEMENQRRRFEKEKDEAYEYGGFAFAKEALNVIDNLDRSKQILTNDEVLKNSEALKKTLEHLDIISKDLISFFLKTILSQLKV